MNAVVQFEEGFQSLTKGNRLYKAAWPVTLQTGYFWKTERDIV